MEKLNKGHWVEVLHTSWMLQDMIENYLISHHVLDQHPDLRKLAEEAQDKINDLYKAISDKMN